MDTNNQGFDLTRIGLHWLCWRGIHKAHPRPGSSVLWGIYFQFHQIEPSWRRFQQIKVLAQCSILPDQFEVMDAPLKVGQAFYIGHQLAKLAAADTGIRR